MSFSRLKTNATTYFITLTAKAPRAFSVLMVLIGNMDKQDTVILTHKEISRLSRLSVTTVKRAIDDLESHNCIRKKRTGRGISCTINNNIATKMSDKETSNCEAGYEPYEDDIILW